MSLRQKCWQRLSAWAHTHAVPETQDNREKKRTNKKRKSMRKRRLHFLNWSNKLYLGISPQTCKEETESISFYLFYKYNKLYQLLVLGACTIFIGCLLSMLFRRWYQEANEKENRGRVWGLFPSCPGFIIVIYHFASWPIHQSQQKVPCLACDIIGLATGTQLPGSIGGHYRHISCTIAITTVF
jgi:hypothetical protein